MLWVYCPGDEAGRPRLLALLAAPPLLALLPYDVGAIRVAGLSFEWWYVRRDRAPPGRLSRRRRRGRALAPPRMTDAVRLLAVWLTPALWLAMPAIILARGPEGLWLGARAHRGSARRARHDGRAGPRRGRRAGRSSAASSCSQWPDHDLGERRIAGDVAAWLGEPRWQGIVVARARGVARDGVAGRGPRARAAAGSRASSGCGVPLVELGARRWRRPARGVGARGQPDRLSLSRLEPPG